MTALDHGGGSRARTLLAQGILAAGALAQFVLVTRWLPAADYGRYGVLTAIFSIGTAIAGQGASNRMMRDVVGGRRPSLLTVGDTARTAVFLVVTLAAGYWLGVGPSGVAAAFVCAVALVAGDLAVGLSLAASSRRFLAVAGLRMATATVLIAVGVAAGRLGLIWVLLAQAVAAASAFVLPALRRSAAWRVQRSTGNPDGVVGYVNGLLWVLAGADRILLARLLPLGDVALYTSAYTILDRFYRTVNSAQVSYSLPRRLEASERVADLDRFERLFRWALVPTGLVAGFVVGPAVSFVSGGRYAPSAAVTWPLVLGLSLSLLAGPAYSAVVAAQAALRLLPGLILAAVVNVVGVLVLVPAFGLPGAAWATVVGYLVWCATVWIVRARPPGQVTEPAVHLTSGGTP